MNQIGILDQQNNGIVKRPFALTVICILGFIGVGLTIPMILSEIALQIGSWFGTYAGFVAVVNLICMIGLWRSKKWGLYFYSSLVLVNQFVLIAKGEWNILVLIIQGIIILIALYHLEPSIKPIISQILLYIKRKMWAITVAYMIGIHNIYKQEDKTPDDIGIVIQDNEAQEDSALKD